MASLYSGDQNSSDGRSITDWLHEFKEASYNSKEDNYQQHQYDPSKDDHVQQQQRYQHAGNSHFQLEPAPNFAPPASRMDGNMHGTGSFSQPPPPFGFVPPPSFNSVPPPSGFPPNPNTSHSFSYGPGGMPHPPFPPQGGFHYPPHSNSYSNAPVTTGSMGQVHNVSGGCAFPQFNSPYRPPIDFGQSAYFQQKNPQNLPYMPHGQSTFATNAQKPQHPSPFLTSSPAFNFNDQSSGKAAGSLDDKAQKLNIGAQEDVNQWLKMKGKLDCETLKTSKNKVAKTSKSIKEQMDSSSGDARQELENNLFDNMNFFQARTIFCKVLHALAIVQGELQNAENVAEIADEETWHVKVEKLKQHKEAYLKIKEEVELSKLVKLKRKIEQRKKKREKRKRQKQEEKEREEQVLFEKAQKHAAIDQWRNKIQQEYLDQQQTKRMKETADKTLGKVRREIKEARKLMDTIARLQKLRDIRNDTAEKRGQVFPPSVSEHFKDKTNDLIQLLTQQIGSCEKEEAALKLILEAEKEEAKGKEREETQRKEEEQKQAETEEDYHCLFGPPVAHYLGDPMQPFANFYQQTQYSIHALQHIRHEWDRFLVAEGTPMASRIPDGWVIPEMPFSAVWASTLQKES